MPERYKEIEDLYGPDIAPPESTTPAPDYSGVNEYYGTPSFTGQSFEDVRRTRAEGRPQGRSMSRNVESAYAEEDAISRLLQGPLSFGEEDKTGRGFAKGSDMDALRQKVLKGIETKGTREQELKVAEAKKTRTPLQNLLDLQRYEKANLSPGQKKTSAGRDKEVLAALKAQLPADVWEQPATQSELIPKVLEITRRGGEYKIVPTPETAERGFVGSLLSKARGLDTSYETGETLWEVEETSPQGGQGTDQSAGGDTISFKTQGDFMDYLLKQQQGQSVR